MTANILVTLKFSKFNSIPLNRYNRVRAWKKQSRQDTESNN